MAGHTLTYWHVAGDLIWRGDGRCTPIEWDQLNGLLDIYRDEVRAAVQASDFGSADQAQRLYRELHEARSAHRQWQRLFERKAA